VQGAQCQQLQAPTAVLPGMSSTAQRAGTAQQSSSLSAVKRRLGLTAGLQVAEVRCCEGCPCSHEIQLFSCEVAAIKSTSST
jgi:hypothetical protein